MDNYEQFKAGMILRDHLALDRTLLANHRTFLAYIRTFVGLFGGGAALVKLVDEPFFQFAGYVFAIASPIFLIMGTIRYVILTRKLRPIAGQLHKNT